jgi:uncharacterized membrane protein YhdT
MEDSQEKAPAGPPGEDLAGSFRQSRKEFRFMILTWVAFAAWTLTYNHFNAKGIEGEAVEIVLGMPKWIIFGILVPWVIALTLTVWFALCFMKDTDLGDDDPTNGKGAA